jgi:hypothetical protein
MAKQGAFDIARRAVALFIVAGVFLLWVGLLLVSFGTAGVQRDIGRFLAFTGSLFAFVVALAGGLGSKQTSDLQNLGLLVLAAALLFVAVSV